MAQADETAEGEPPKPAPPVPVPGPGASFADRLNYLFDRVRPPGAEEFSNAHVARTICSYGEASITGAYIGQLRKGVKLPGYPLLKPFADFFGVKPSFFVDDETTRRVTGQFELLRELSQAGVKQVALRAIGLSPQSLNEVMKKIEAVREQEGLPPAPDEDLP
ncbi:hypothetical protein ACRWOO_02750 [Streptomyces sp. NEAU-PBA10]|uniref:XRE family transcriptional regulator n=2 Tax=Streptomyces TaxID=1883 RepID=A0ABP7DZT0_9ACTN|nr:MULTISPECIES: hypothetical protein [Streptomyces]MBZ3908462.1 hypothetical protein [Streptomyces griseiscabiei]MDX2913980.1 hypothetical protein [Streptomyces griseiscabiei]